MMANQRTNPKDTFLNPNIPSDTYAPVKDNLGSLTLEGKLVTPGIADARVDTVRGFVIVTTADAEACAAIALIYYEMFMPLSIFH